MFELKRTHVPLAGSVIILAALVFVLDQITELGVAGGVPYVVPVIVSLWLPGRRYTILVAIVTTVLTILGLLLSPPGGELWKVLMNRSYAVFAIWMVTLVGMQRKGVEEALKVSNDSLEHRVAERTQELEGEITQREQAEATLRFLLAIRQAINQSPDTWSGLTATLQTVCETTGWAYGESWVPAQDGAELEPGPV